jgi:LmbE family N-acetylglucosaminyl deacetylase
VAKNRLLLVFAHPDDESFTAGGTIAKYAHQGVVSISWWPPKEKRVKLQITVK